MPLVDDLRRFGAALPWPLRALGRGYLSFGKVFSRIITFLIMTILYWLVLPFFSFLRLGDPLKESLQPKNGTYWLEKKRVPETLERFARPF